MKDYAPPFQLTHAMFSKAAQITERLGAWKQAHAEALMPQLRRGNRIRTIQASLAIEQNTLTVEQVTAVLEGRQVIGHPREIQEVRNAIATYDAMADWSPYSLDDLLAAHGLMMQALVDDAGMLRQGGVGIYQGKQLIHMAPPASQLQRLLTNLLQWLQQTEAHPLIASCAFHYEFEFIHPFSDGNGRMGRLWQTVILGHWQPMMAFLPVETVIKNRQSDYYRLLSEADKASDCTAFILFLLEAIEESLLAALETSSPDRPDTTQETTSKTTQETTQEKILAILRANPAITRNGLAEKLGLTPDGAKYHLQKLKAKGRIRHIGSTKAGHWEVIEP